MFSEVALFRVKIIFLSGPEADLRKLLLSRYSDDLKKSKTSLNDLEK
jgi:hypothetical protein